MKFYFYIFLIIAFVSSGFGAGWYAKGLTTKKDSFIEIVKNVDKPVYKTVYVPSSPAEWQQWEKSPIIIDREIKGEILSIYAHDGYKESRVTDKLQIATFGDWKVYAGLSAAAFVIGAGAISALRR